MKKIKKKSNNEDRPSISWQAPEFEYFQKDVSWYWLSLIVAIILIAVSIWQKNFIFVIFVVIAWLVVVYLAGRPTTIWEFKINEDGIEISLPDSGEGKKIYPYNEINGFDIHPATEEYKELVLKLKSKFSPYLKINFHAADEKKIEAFLRKFLPREEYEKSLTDSFSKLIRF